MKGPPSVLSSMTAMAGSPREPQRPCLAATALHCLAPATSREALRPMLFAGRQPDILQPPMPGRKASPPSPSPPPHRWLPPLAAEYVAPEVVSAGAQRGHGAMEECTYGPQADLWSCGVILFMLLSGYPPFWHADVAQLLRRVQAGRYEFAEPVWCQVSDGAKDLVRRLLVVDPDQRLTADQVGADLDSGASGASTCHLQLVGEAAEAGCKKPLHFVCRR